MKKNKGFNERRTFGVEIEFFFKNGMSQYQAGMFAAKVIREAGFDCRFEGYETRTTEHWKIVTDSSVHYEGLELVSPVMSGHEGLEELRKVLEALNEAGAQVDSSCGVHVHHDAGDFTLRTFKNLYGLQIRFEDAIDELVAPSRRGDNNRYCRSNDRNLNVLANASSVTEIIDRIYPSRYVKLNCQSYRRIGTIEFRQHQGSTNYKKIAAWIVFTQMMVEKAVHGTVQLKHGASDWFNLKKVIRGYKWMGADETQVKAISYLNKRRQQLAS